MAVTNRKNANRRNSVDERDVEMTSSSWFGLGRAQPRQSKMGQRVAAKQMQQGKGEISQLKNIQVEEKFGNYFGYLARCVEKICI